MDKLSIYVVSLEKDVHRREQLAKQFTQFYPTMNIIDAVDGRKLSDDIIRNLTKGYVQKYHKQMSPGELGCTMSHIKALEQFLESDSDVALILEDDILGTDENIQKLIDLNVSSVDDNAMVMCWNQKGSARVKY